MKNSLTLILLSLLFMAVDAQQSHYGWGIGVSGGALNYHGDLSDQIVDWQEWRPGAGIQLQHNLNSSLSLRAEFIMGQVQSNDRKESWSGDVINSASNFDRALNFRSDIKDVRLNFIFHTDNGWLFSKRAAVSPYFLVGLGNTNYKVYADLRQEDGSAYYYWEDGLIRDIDENDPEAGKAVEIIQDGDFETNLSNIQTEEGKEQQRNAFQIPMGAGLKFKLGSRVNLTLENTWAYLFTDQLDDVSNNPVNADPANNFTAYAANPAGTISGPRGTAGNDWTSYTSIGLQINFHRKSSAFKAPYVYAGSGALQTRFESPFQVKMEPQTVETASADSLVSEEQPMQDLIVEEPMEVDFPAPGNLSDTVEISMGVSATKVTDSLSLFYDDESDMPELFPAADKPGFAPADSGSFDELPDDEDQPTDDEIAILEAALIAGEPEDLAALFLDPVKDAGTEVTAFDLEAVLLGLPDPAGKIEMDEVVFPDSLNTTLKLMNIPAATVSDDINSRLAQLELQLQTESENETELAKTMKEMLLLIQLQMMAREESTAPSESNAPVESEAPLESDVQPVIPAAIEPTEVENQIVPFPVPVPVLQEERLSEIEAISKLIDSLHNESNLDSAARTMLVRSEINRAIAEFRQAQLDEIGTIPVEESTSDENLMMFQLQQQQMEREQYLAFIREMQMELSRKESAGTQSDEGNVLFLQGLYAAELNESNKVKTKVAKLNAELDSVRREADMESITLQKQISGLEVEAVQSESELAAQKKANTEMKEKLAALERETAVLKSQLAVTNSELDRTKKISSDEKSQLQADLSKLSAEAQAREKLARQTMLRKKEVDSVIAYFPVVKVFFASNSSTVPTQSYSELEYVRSVLNTYPELIAEVEGYADQYGHAEYNRKLSEKRGVAVIDVLASNELPRDRTRLLVFGSTKGDTETEGMTPAAYGRRVQVKLRRR